MLLAHASDSGEMANAASKLGGPYLHRNLPQATASTAAGTTEEGGCSSVRETTKRQALMTEGLLQGGQLEMMAASGSDSLAYKPHTTEFLHRPVRCRAHPLAGSGTFAYAQRHLQVCARNGALIEP